MSEGACHDRHRLTAAARLLFPAAEVAGPGFWAALDLPRLKQAFRREVRRWHPDTASPSPQWPTAVRQARFVAVKQAYDLLRDYLGQAAPLSEPRVIAVAGAKGGVGASLMAANLGVLLARRGRRVILADLDPAGPTLPFYLGNVGGHWRGTAEGVAAAQSGRAQPSRYGPVLVTGMKLPRGGPQGTRRRHFLAEMHGLEADDVLCDLGSAPGDETLDLFGAAHRQLLVTTCEPAAYVRAYAFLRRLRQRLSEPPHPTAGGPAPSELRPFVLFNQVTSQDRAEEMGRRLAEVAARCLGLRVTVLRLPYEEEIAHSARDLVPAASRRGGAASRQLTALARIFIP